MVMILALLLAGAQELLVKGVAALKAGDIRIAKTALEEAVRLAPVEPVIWLAVAEARLRNGEPGPAISAVERATKLAPKSAVVQRGRALFARRLGSIAQDHLDRRQEKKAEEILQAALRAFELEPELWRLLGLSLYAQGRSQAAVDAFLRAIDAAPDEESLYAGLETLLPAGKEAEARLAKFAESHPKSAVGWYLLGLERGDNAFLERAWELDPTFWPAAFALHRSAPPDRAVVLLEQVIALHPGYAPAYNALAQTYARMGEREKAKAARQRHHELTFAAK